MNMSIFFSPFIIDLQNSNCDLRISQILNYSEVCIYFQDPELTFNLIAISLFSIHLPFNEVSKLLVSNRMAEIRRS